MRVCIVYDCLFPCTIGGAERWYRQVAEAHAAAGNAVTYLTMRQWNRGAEPVMPGVKILAVGPRMALYTDQRRRVLPPLIFGLGVAWHLLRHRRRYDVVHTASFPFFSLLAAGLVKPMAAYRIAVDWHEVWTRAYWRHYLGLFGDLGWYIQWLCARVPQIAFSFSRLHRARAQSLGLADVTLLEGEYGGEAILPVDAADPPYVLYVGRFIAEKRVPLLVEALALAMHDNPRLNAELIGMGPDFDFVTAQIASHGLGNRIALPGFVDASYLANRQLRASVIVQPSEREGYGMAVVEAAARGVIVIVVAAPDNASVELIDQGENGFVVPTADPAALAQAIAQALNGGAPLRARVSQWFARNRHRISFDASFARILARTKDWV